MYFWSIFGSLSNRVSLSMLQSFGLDILLESNKYFFLIFCLILETLKYEVMCHRDMFFEKKITSKIGLNRVFWSYWNYGIFLNLNHNESLNYHIYLPGVQITDFQTPDKMPHTIYLPDILKIHQTSFIMATFDVDKYSFCEISTSCINKPCINHPLQKV